MFSISRLDLERLVAGLDPGVEIGYRLLLHDGRPQKVAVTVAQLLEMGESRDPDTFTVEEQDHAWYMIHLGQAVEDSVTIGKASISRESISKCMMDGRPRWP